MLPEAATSCSSTSARLAAEIEPFVADFGLAWHAFSSCGALVGHVHRMRPYAEALAARGHEVAWAAHRGLIGDLLPEDSRLPAGR